MMKMAKVVPRYKKGDKHIISNYRPVSVNRLDDFMEYEYEHKYELLNEHQYMSI